MIRDRILASIVAAALAKGLLVGWLIPPFQTPDEYAHYDYVIYLSTVGLGRVLSGRIATPERVSFDRCATRELLFLADATGQRPHLEDAIISRPPPRVADAMRRAAAWQPPADEAERLAGLRELNAVFNYPPLYYGLVATLHRVGTALGVNPLALFYAARALSLVLFLAAIVAVHQLARALGLSRRVSLAVAFAMAFQPQLTMQSVSVQPDNLSLLLVTLALFGLSAFAREPSRASAAGWGLATGLLLLTKVHLAVPLVVAAVVVAVWHLPSSPARARATVSSAMVGFATAALVGGGWLVRSRILYGNWTGYMVWMQAGSGNAIENLSDWWHLWLPLTFRSWWGEWGWLDYGLPDGLQQWLLGFSLAPALMLVLWWVANTVPDARVPGAEVLRAEVPGGVPADSGVRTRQWAVVAVAMAAFTAVMLSIAATMGEVNNQGRHWLPFAAVQILYLCLPVALLDAGDVRRLTRLSSLGGRAARLVAISCAGLGAVGLTVTLAGMAVTGFVDVPMRADTNSWAEVFVDTGRGIDPLDVSVVRILRRDGEATRRFRIYGSEVRAVRFDPLAGAGTVDVGDVRILDAAGRTLLVVPARALRVVHEIESTTPLPEGRVRVTSSPGAADPILDVPLARPVALEPGRLARTALVVRRAWHAALRRLPMLAWLPWLTPTLLLAALAPVVLGRVGARLAACPHERRPVERLLCLVLVAGGTILVSLNMWLVLATWSFYYR